METTYLFSCGMLPLQALAGSKGREALAEDVVALREALTRAREDAVGAAGLRQPCSR